MSSIANQELPLLSLFRPVFTAATFVRAQPLGVAAILTNGRRTVTNLVRSVAALTAFFLAAILVRFIVQHFWPQGRIRLVGDDTVTEHPGRKVYRGEALAVDALAFFHGLIMTRPLKNSPKSSDNFCSTPLPPLPDRSSPITDFTDRCKSHAEDSYTRTPNETSQHFPTRVSRTAVAGHWNAYPVVINYLAEVPPQESMRWRSNFQASRPQQERL
jgi:hypothetical protein